MYVSIIADIIKSIITTEKYCKLNENDIFLLEENIVPYRDMPLKPITPAIHSAVISKIPWYRK